MFGFIFGSACLIGLAIVAARGHRHGGYHRFRRSPRSAVFAVLERLETTPGQEKAIRTAFDEFVESVRPLRKDLSGTREDVARAVRGERIDEAALSGAFEKHDAGLQKLRTEFTRLLASIHETLDDRQRRRLADLVESASPFALRHGCA